MTTKKPTKKSGRKLKNKVIVVCDDCRKPYKPKCRTFGKLKARFCSACQGFGNLSNEWKNRGCESCKVDSRGFMVGVGDKRVAMSISWCKNCSYFSIHDHCGYWECCGKILNETVTK